MTSKNRKEQQNFNLQPTISLNGQHAASGAKRDGKDKASQSDASETGNPQQPHPLGKIEVSPKAISHLASRAAQASYGVVGLASRHARPGLAELLRREEEHKGVEVKFSGERVVIDLYVIIEYGTRISEVARNIMSNTKFAVESALGVPVVNVNVNVQGIRVSS
ncbi:MAG TPA: Asp23/Gls24 family envelope stress response protein [Chloroflexia bacterium]|nr:Asp23/Gls24 family envelope stress response protein [Chloroflexia bacterium]